MTIKSHKYLGGHVAPDRNGWRATLTIGSRRLRFRAVGIDAEEVCRQWIRSQVLDERALTKEELGDARSALSILPEGWTLRDAADLARRTADADGGRTVAAAIQSRLETAAASNLRPDSLKALRHRLSKLADAMGPRRLSSVTPDDARAFLTAAAAEPATRNGYRSAASSVYRLAARAGYTGRNPFDAIPPAKTTDKPIPLYTPAQVAAVLRKAEEAYPELLPALPILFFSGMRTKALLHLTADAILPGAIRVGSTIDKTRRTYLAPILPPLAAWLEAYPPRARIANPTSESRWQLHRRECHAAAGVPVLPDGHRHAYASYRLAQIADAHRVAAEIGHWESADTLLRHYYAAATPDAAKAYFSLLPTKKNWPPRKNLRQTRRIITH